MSTSPENLSASSQDSATLIEQLSQANSRDEALATAIKAAEASMQAMKIAEAPAERTYHSTRIKQLLSQAEDIKQTSDWRSVVKTNPITRSRVLKEPQPTRNLPKQEQILLLKASYLNGSKFPPWTGPPDQSEFVLNDGEGLFFDTTELPLSEYQEDVLDDWKRPADALPPPSWSLEDRANLGPSMKFARPIDLVQDAATDCSVVASLCAGVARAQKGHDKILRTVIHPYDAANGRPVISSNGKYVVRLNFNGCYRKVVIDDRLPTSCTGRIIHVVDRNNPGLLWPPLIEKAYLKVRGGYDFPGSNSGTDLWIITGWIPEQVFLASDELEPGRLWERISNAFSYGDVLITMGTPKMSCRSERELGLAGEHDYAVLDLKQVDSQRLFLIKNPWCEGPSWRGKSNTSPSDQQAGAIDDLHEQPVHNSRDLLNADDQLSPGTFWMDIDNVIQHFESIYLNWNPGLFACRQDLHFAWDISQQPRGAYASLSQHPQYTITSEKGGIVWVLLCRHFQNAVPPDATEEDIEKDRYGIELSGHMSLNAFRADARRVLLPDKAVEKGPFVDSPQTLLKLDCEAKASITLVPAEQDLPTIRHTFTISAFSNAPITLAEATPRYRCERTLTGSWTKETAGGNAHSPDYSTNPQYSISITQRTNISILLQSVDDELNVHFKLIHSDGKRVHSVRNRDIVIDSKDYRRGCCTAEYNELAAGRYTIICSTFEPQQYGSFTLLIESGEPAQVEQLPREGAGRVRLELENVLFRGAQCRMAIPIVPFRLVKLYAVARFVDDTASGGSIKRSASNRSLLRMSLELGRGPSRRVLADSNGGEYSDGTGGLRIEDVDLKPDYRRFGDIWLVLDRLHVNAEEREEALSVVLFVDQPGALERGSWRPWED